MSVETIECAIARHWPDIGKICADANATSAQVHEVIAALERIENTPRREHDCAKHIPGSLECHDEHLCWCPECKEAAQMRARAMQANHHRSVEVRAHAEYEQLRKMGYGIHDMPAWVRDGERAYHAGRIRKLPKQRNPS